MFFPRLPLVQVLHFANRSLRIDQIFPCSPAFSRLGGVIGTINGASRSYLVLQRANSILSESFTETKKPNRPVTFKLCFGRPCFFRSDDSVLHSTKIPPTVPKRMVPTFYQCNVDVTVSVFVLRSTTLNDWRKKAFMNSSRVCPFHRFSIVPES